MENVKKIKFVAVVYGLLWLRFCMEIKIHDEYDRRDSSLVWKQNEKNDMHLGLHGYMRRSLHQGRFQLLWCFRPHHWPSQEEAPWMPPLAMANASLSKIYLLTSHHLRKSWRCNAAMAYKAWLQGQWIMHLPK